MAKATGAPVYCPKLEVPVLADIMAWVPWPGIGPFESYDADETLEGGERLELAGLEIDVLFTPGHSPGHVDLLDPGRAACSSPATCSSRARSAAPTCPAATTQRLLQSIGELLEALPGRDRACCPATWRRPRSAPSAPPTRSCTNSRRERPDPGPARHVRRAGRRRARPRRGSRRPRAGILEPRRLRAHRDARRSRPRSCSRAAWGSPPTSCRRRCTRSTPASRSR